MRSVPESLVNGPFTRAEAGSLGVSSRMLEGSRFVRIHPRVWRYRDHVMTEADWVMAASMALPPEAHLTGITRIQRLGLDFGPRRPIRFVIEGELHIALPGTFLHRTKLLPPIDAGGVTPAAAFISYCTRARVIDAIKVGDWLLHREHMSTGELSALALGQPWRDGALEALWVVDHLDARARSIKESETRAVLSFAGLPAPELNVAVDVGEDVEVLGDLVYRAWGAVVEYEGRQHQEDRAQYVSDLDRYALFRRAGVTYIQVTSEKLAHARTLVGEVFRELLDSGYDGPQPVFGNRWRSLFLRLSVIVGQGRGRPGQAVS